MHCVSCGLFKSFPEKGSNESPGVSKRLNLFRPVEPVQDTVEQFIAARQLSGRPLFIEDMSRMSIIIDEDHLAIIL